MHRPFLAVFVIAILFASVQAAVNKEAQDVAPPPQIIEKYTPRIRVPPIYPPMAYRRGISGWALLEFTITKKGRPRAIRVLRSSSRIFERVSIRAVSFWRYDPIKVDGVVVALERVRTVIVFDADRERARIAETRRKMAERWAEERAARMAKKAFAGGRLPTGVRLPSGKAVDVVGLWVGHSAWAKPVKDPKTGANTGKTITAVRAFRCAVLFKTKTGLTQDAPQIARELMQAFVKNELEKQKPDDEVAVSVGTIVFVSRDPSGQLKPVETDAGNRLQYRFRRNREGRWRMEE